MSDEKKKLSSDEAEAVLARAAKLAAADQSDDRVSKADVKAGALEVGIDPRYVDRAERELAVERERAARESALRAASAARTKKTISLVVGALVLVVGLFTALQISTVSARYEEVERTRGQLDNVMQRRRDLVPDLLTLAKAEAVDEAARIATIEALSSKVRSERDPEKRIADDEALVAAMRELHEALAAKPGLGSSPLFVRLSDEMAGSANRISVERKRHVEAVTAYRAAVRGPIGGVARVLAGLPDDVDAP